MATYYYKSELSGGLLKVRPVDVPSLDATEVVNLTAELVAAGETDKLEIYNSTTGFREIWNGTEFTGASSTVVIISLGAIDADIAVNTDIDYFDAPFDGVLNVVEATLEDAATGATLATFNVNKNGVTMLGTAITIDATEVTSTTAVTPPVISVTTFVKGDRISTATDAVGDTTPGTGGKVYLYITKT